MKTINKRWRPSSQISDIVASSPFFAVSVCWRQADCSGWRQTTAERRVERRLSCFTSSWSVMIGGDVIIAIIHRSSADYLICFAGGPGRGIAAVLIAFNF